MKQYYVMWGGLCKFFEDRAAALAFAASLSGPVKVGSARIADVTFARRVPPPKVLRFNRWELEEK